MAAAQNSKDPALAEALARIEELNRRLGFDPAEDPVLASHRAAEEAAADPITRAATALGAHMREKLSQVERKMEREQGRMDRWIQMRDRAVRTGDEVAAADAQSYIDEDTPEFEKEMARFKGHISALNAKIARLETDPASMFLPLGTVVRFTDAHIQKLSDGYGDPNKMYPVPGSIGVVTGLNHSSEFPIAVSLRRPFKTGYGEKYKPDYSRPPTYLVDPEKVEVIEPGLLPGGVPCEAYGFVPTHSRSKEVLASRNEHEMIVEADGYFWRLCEFNDGHVEVLQAYDRIEEMTWVAGPLDADEAPSSPKPF